MGKYKNIAKRINEISSCAECPISSYGCSRIKCGDEITEEQIIDQLSFYKEQNKFYENAIKNIEEWNLPLLDDIEKKYLSTLLKPYIRQNAKVTVEKYGITHPKEWLVITLWNDHDEIIHCFHLPPFDKDTMYCGLKPRRQYTTKELEL